MSDDRKAAMLARRAQWATPVEVDTIIADLREGDHVIVVPTQHGVRGVRVGANVTSITSDDTTWKERMRGSRHGWPVDSRRIVFASIDAVLNLPIHFTVKVQRVA